MAWTTPKTFVSGERLFASDLNTYVSDNLADLDPRTVKSFADASARTTAIPSPAAGAVTFLEDTDAVEVYDGSAWKTLKGGIVKYEYVTDTIDRSTTSTSWTDAGISITYTPTYANSLLVVEWSGAVYSHCTGTTTSVRWGDYRLVDTVDGPVLGAEAARIGRFLIASSTAGAYTYDYLRFRALVTAGSVSARTYRLEYESNNAQVTVGLANASRSAGVLSVTELGSGVL